MMKTEQRENTEKELIKWVKFLLMPNELEDNDMENNESLKKAKEELEKMQNDEYEQEMAELRMKHIRDTKSVEAYGYDKGKAEGIEIGLAEGIEKGREIAEAEAEENANKTLAKKLLSKGYPPEEIIEVTGITKEELEKL